MCEKCHKNKTSKTIQEKDKNREKIEKIEANRSDKTKANMYHAKKSNKTVSRDGKQ